MMGSFPPPLRLFKEDKDRFLTPAEHQKAFAGMLS